MANTYTQCYVHLVFSPDRSRAPHALRIDPAREPVVTIGVWANADHRLILRTSSPSAEYSRSIVRFLLTRSPIGVTFGTSTLFGLIVGFVIVALSMFSAVVDNLREFGTLKAIGATTWDLAKLLLVQSVAYAWLGSLIGLALVTRLAEAIRSPKLAVILPPQLLLGTTLLMTVLCISASSLALLRIRKVEPAMVFR